MKTWTTVIAAVPTEEIHRSSARSAFHDPGYRGERKARAPQRPLANAATDFYVDSLMDEWRIRKASSRIQTCMRRVLRELLSESLVLLRNEPKLEVMVRREADHSVWAYFPMHPRLQTPKLPPPKPRTTADLIIAIKEAKYEFYRRRLAAQKYQPKPATRVLLVLSEKHFEKQSLKLSASDLRHHFGHVLLYLRNQRARNECIDAEREWNSSHR
jgi:hypothetical protein